MKFLGALLISGLLLMGCGGRAKPDLLSTDAKLAKAITGVWTEENHGMMTLASDGSFSSAWTNFHSNPVQGWTYEGKWKITNGV